MSRVVIVHKGSHLNIENRVALVTGGASGLGRATARALRSAGARVVILDLPSSNGALVAEEIGATFAPADVTSEEQVVAAVAAAAALGPLSVAVNCAGIGYAVRVIGRDGTVFPLAEFVKVVNVNLIGTFNVIRLAAARMIASTPADGEERGVIVNTASVAAFDGQIAHAAYSASKSGVASLTLPLARDLAESKIRVMTIAPGIFDTPLFHGLPDETVASLSEQVPHPTRLGDPSEYAALVLHVIANPMLNGETVRLDGGMRITKR